MTKGSNNYRHFTDNNFEEFKYLLHEETWDEVLASKEPNTSFNLFMNTFTYYRIFWPITRALSIQKGSEIIKNEHARYTLERFPTNNARVICTKKGIGKYGIIY